MTRVFGLQIVSCRERQIGGVATTDHELLQIRNPKSLHLLELQRLGLVDCECLVNYSKVKQRGTDLGIA